MQDIKRIMIIDDFTPFVRSMRSILNKGYDCEVHFAYTFREAYRILSKYDKPFHVILIDIKLTDGEGLDLLPTIAEKSPDARVIFMTGVDQKDFEEDFKDKGVKEIIYKPFDVPSLLEQLDLPKAVE